VVGVTKFDLSVGTGCSSQSCVYTSSGSSSLCRNNGHLGSLVLCLLLLYKIIYNNNNNKNKNIIPFTQYNRDCFICLALF
jgi:hypothetical protein